MDNVLYDIYFRGGVMPGENLDNVKTNLGKLFKANSAQIDAMFSGRAIVIKKDLNKEAALKYQSAIEKAGARVILREKTTGTSSPTQTQAATPPQEEGSWNLAPTGSDLLRESERNPFEPAEIDTSAIKLASVFDQPQTDTRPPPPPPNTDHISVAEVGSDILAEKPPEAPKPDIDLSGLEIEQP